MAIRYAGLEIFCFTLFGDVNPRERGNKCVSYKEGWRGFFFVVLVLRCQVH